METITRANQSWMQIQELRFDLADRDRQIRNLNERVASQQQEIDDLKRRLPADTFLSPNSTLAVAKPAGSISLPKIVETTDEDGSSCAAKPKPGGEIGTLKSELEHARKTIIVMQDRIMALTAESRTQLCSRLTPRQNPCHSQSSSRKTVSGGMDKADKCDILLPQPKQGVKRRSQPQRRKLLRHKQGGGEPQVRVSLGQIEMVRGHNIFARASNAPEVGTFGEECKAGVDNVRDSDARSEMETFSPKCGPLDCSGGCLQRESIFPMIKLTPATPSVSGNRKRGGAAEYIHNLRSVKLL